MACTEFETLHVFRWWWWWWSEGRGHIEYTTWPLIGCCSAGGAGGFVQIPIEFYSPKTVMRVFYRSSNSSRSSTRFMGAALVAGHGELYILLGSVLLQFITARMASPVRQRWWRSASEIRFYSRKAKLVRRLLVPSVISYGSEAHNHST